MTDIEVCSQATAMHDIVLLFSPDEVYLKAMAKNPADLALKPEN